MSDLASQPDEQPPEHADLPGAGKQTRHKLNRVYKMATATVMYVRISCIITQIFSKLLNNDCLRNY